MESLYSHSKQQAFILRPESLEKLTNTLQNRGLNLENITANCKDNVSRRFKLLDEFLSMKTLKVGKLILYVFLFSQMTTSKRF